jgi:hypothetical protein
VAVAQSAHRLKLVGVLCTAGLHVGRRPVRSSPHTKQSRRPGSAGLEDGTPAFAAIAAARHGFAFLRRLTESAAAPSRCPPGRGTEGQASSSEVVCGGPAPSHAHSAAGRVITAIEGHTAALASYLVTQLVGLRHSNGRPLAVLYGRPPLDSEPQGNARIRSQAASEVQGQATQGVAAAGPADPSLVQVAAPTGRNAAHPPGGLPPCVSGWGPTVAFNLQRPDGSWVGYQEV